MALLDELKSAVHQTTTIKASVQALVSGLAAKLAALAGQPTIDPAELQAIVDELSSDNSDFGALVTANTIADPVQAAHTGGATSSAQAPATPPPAPAATTAPADDPAAPESAPAAPPDPQS